MIPTEREKDPEHIAICLNDLAIKLGQISKYIEEAAHDARRIAWNLRGGMPNVAREKR